MMTIETLYDDNRKFCRLLLDKFCVSMVEKNPKKFESINCHLLRHLARQSAEIGPLFVTSASMFESALHLLIASLTGTTYHCKLMVERFIRGKVLSEIESSEDDLAQFLRFSDNPSDVNETFGLVESEELRELRFNNQSA